MFSTAYAGEYLINDDFESDTVGQIPDGWIMEYNGQGDSYQKVVDNVSYSGNNSFKLDGTGWAAVFYKLLNIDIIPATITVEAYIRPASTGESGSISLYNTNRTGTESCLARITFGDWGIAYSEIGHDNKDLVVIEENYSIDTWYHIKIIHDLTTRKYDVYINNVLKASNIDMYTDGTPDSVMLASGNDGGDCIIFFDDVKVYSGVTPPGSDATLSDLKIDGTTVDGFDPDILSYDMELPAGTTEVPTVTAAVYDENATAEITPAESLPSTTTVLVTAEDGITTETYSVNFTVADDTIPPELTAGAANRTSSTEATVKFTSNEAGEYYYQIVEEGEAVPTIDTSGAGTVCDTTEQTISLNTLTTGAKDIYIVVKDAAGNVSEALKMNIPLPVVEVNSDITSPTTWTSDNIYHVTGQIEIFSELIINEGTIVKFDSGGFFIVQNGGNLTTTGTESNPVYFTSIKDDGIGGDTNGDGTATTPSAGDWYGIRDSYGASYAGEINLTYTEIKYGGKSYANREMYGSINNWDGNLTLSNVTITDSNIDAVRINPGMQIDNTVSLSNITIQNSQKNGIYIINGSAAIDGSATVNGGTITGNGDYGIKVDYLSGEVLSIPPQISGVTIEDNDDGAVYLHPRMSGTVVSSDSVLDRPIDIGAGEIRENTTWTANQTYNLLGDVHIFSWLNIDGGAIIKASANGYILVRDGGSFAANGTEANPIYFTSIKDDTIGGDSDGDGAASTPSPGDWSGLRVVSGGSLEMSNIEISYGGKYNSTYELDGSINNTSGMLTLSNITITNSARHGIKIWSGGTTEISDCAISNSANNGVYIEAAGAVLNGCSIMGNGQYGVYIKDSAEAITISDSTIQNNTLGQIYISNSPNVTILSTPVAEITAEVSPGETEGTTKVMATAGSGNHLVIAVSDTKISTPDILSAAPTGAGVTDPYVSENDIAGVDAETDKYVGVYEVNADNKVVGFKLLALTESDINISDAQKVSADKAALTWDVIKNTNLTEDNVTADMNLITTGTVYGSSISWATSDPDVITVTGRVYRPDYSTGDKEVTLTATITNGSVEDTSIFQLTVIMQPQTDEKAVAQDKAALDIGYALGDSAEAITQDLEFITAGPSGTTITWLSDNTAVITNDGTVTRPSYEEGDAIVKVTASVYKNGISDTKEFSVTVLKLEPSTNANLSELAADGITLTPEFSSDTTAYSASVGNNTSSATITATASDGTATVKINGAAGASREVALSVGSNTITVEVTAQDGTTQKSYTININRASGGSSGGSSSSSRTERPAEPKPSIYQITDTKNTITGINITPLASDGLSLATVTEEAVEALIAKAKETTGGDETIEIKVTANSKTLMVTIPRESFAKITTKTKAGVRISAPVATVHFNEKAVEVINEAAEGSGSIKVAVGTVDAEKLPAKDREKVKERPVYEFEVKAGSADVSHFSGGRAKVSIPYNLRSGENPNFVVVYCLGNDGTLKTVRGRYDKATGRVLFSTPHFSKFIIGYNAVSFKDVKAGAWYAEAVEFIAARGITTGTGDGYYSPEDKLTRGQFLVMMMRAYNIEPDENPTDNFVDAGSTYYTNYLSAAKRLGISKGVGNNRYAPDREITRQEVFTLLYNSLKLLRELPEDKAEKRLTEFSDAEEIAPWAREAMESLVKSGIVKGSGDRLLPKKISNRAQMAQVLYNLLTQ
jgi:hypothetical protein